MDSISQFALGSAVGGAVLGHRAGAKALLWGGLVATVPDLDVLVPLADAVSRFTYHRSFSHSVFVLTLITPLLAWLILRIHPGERERRRGWLRLVWLALITHVLLDCFTVYGTQILWPIWPHPVGWSTVFIIDPAYTLPLLLAVIAALCLRRHPQRLRRWAIGGLVASSAYLAFGVGAKLQVERVARDSLAAQGLPYSQLLTVPTAFNGVLWRVLAMDADGYYEGYYSLFDEAPRIAFSRHASAPALIEPVREAFAPQRLAWFTKGFYRVSERDGRIVMTDLRMGQEPAYTFSFVVAERRGGEIVAVPNEPAPRQTPRLSKLRELWARIVHGPDYRMQM